MPEASNTSDGPNDRHVFRESPPLPTYLVSFAVGRFALAKAAGEPAIVQAMLKTTDLDHSLLLQAG
jgi:aminopeptidase N